MMQYTSAVMSRADTAARDGASIEDILHNLRELCLDDFGELLFSMPNNAFPTLSKVLPAMASTEVQNNWTGENGYPLLRKTLSFLRSVDYFFSKITSRNLQNSKVLDFGCGYGRMIRLMYYFTNPENIFAVDPWDESIRLCHEAKVLGNFAISDYVPRLLPFQNVRYDLIYAFSVFTHLSEKTTKIALQTLRNYTSDDGLLVITIRPEEYWLDTKIDPSCNRTKEEVLADHQNGGFSFVPHNRSPIDGDITYGDTSMTFEWLNHNAPEWTLVSYDRSLLDPYQILVFLTPSSK